MTAQITDAVRHEGRSWALAASDGAGLFDPRTYGLKPVMPHTACHNGYYCAYAVEDSALVLVSLTIGVDPAGMLRAKYRRGVPLLLGVEPVIAESEHAVAYSGLREPVPFTGRLVLGAGFIPFGSRRITDAITAASKYSTAPCCWRDVRELRFDAGRFVREDDRTAEAAAERERLGWRVSGAADTSDRPQGVSL